MKAWAVHGKSKLTGTVNRETKEEKSQEHDHHFTLPSRGLFTENSFWQAKQSIPNTTVTFYGDYVKMCEDFAPFAPNFDDKNWLLHHDNAPFHSSFFTTEFLTKITWLLFPTHPTFLCLPDWSLKSKSHHFDTIETIETESHAVLNTHTEHNFQDAFKNGRRAGKGVYGRKGNTWRVMVASRPKVIFWRDGNYEWLFVEFYEGTNFLEEYSYIQLLGGRLLLGDLEWWGRKDLAGSDQCLFVGIVSIFEWNRKR
jgi:hypothetical protein